MKKIKILNKAFLTVATASLIFIGCQKSAEVSNSVTPEELEQTITISEGDAEAEVLYDDVFDNVMGVDDQIGIGSGIGVHNASNGNGEIGDGIAARTDSNRCFTKTVTPQTPGVFPKTIVLDFGNGCTGPGGHVRKGKIITVYTGPMFIPGSKATTTFDNYYVDSNKIEGVHVIQNNSTSNNKIFTVRVENGKITKPSGNYTAWNKNKTWTQTEGNGTPNFPVDDVYSITGTASGTIKKGTVLIQWSSEIIQPVIRKFTCRWPVQGQVRKTRNSRTSVLDYGNGTCDNKAIITINGQTHQITLR